MFSADAKSTAFGVKRSAIASIPLCTAGEMPNASPPHTNNTRMVGILRCIEYENYDYKSIIQRSPAGAGAYPIDLADPVLGQPRPALTRTTTHDKENLKTWAYFIQDQIALTESLKALAGLRFERFEHDYDNYLPGTKGWGAADNSVNPRLGLIYDLTDTVAVYAITA